MSAFPDSPDTLLTKKDLSTVTPSPLSLRPVFATLPEGEIDEDGVSILSADAARQIQLLRERLTKRSRDQLGFPFNADHSQYLGPIHDLLRFSVNNLGDPFDPSNYHVDTNKFEQQVVDIFAQLWQLKPGTYWGYVAHSGTEGNRLCLDIAGRRFPNGRVYFSKATHPSIPASIVSYRLDGCVVNCQPSGEIDYEELRIALAEGRKKKQPAIVVLNTGSTMTGAFDEVSVVTRLLEETGYDLEQDVYIHIDGNLAGITVPFLDFSRAPPVALKINGKIQLFPRTASDFHHPAVASFACSGHKFLGCPTPSAATVVRLRFVELVKERIEYLNSNIITAMGSRNGHSSVFMWHELQRKGVKGLLRDIENCLKNAEYLKQLLTAYNISCFHNPLSNTVVFERPCEKKIIDKYHLECNQYIGKVVVMPSVNRSQLDRFATELGDAMTANERPCLLSMLGHTATCFCGRCHTQSAIGGSIYQVSTIS